MLALTHRPWSSYHWNTGLNRWKSLSGWMDQGAVQTDAFSWMELHTPGSRCEFQLTQNKMMEENKFWLCSSSIWVEKKNNPKRASCDSARLQNLKKNVHLPDTKWWGGDTWLYCGDTLDIRPLNTERRGLTQFHSFPLDTHTYLQTYSVQIFDTVLDSG